jgi:predicted amidophosphoribosyltransferase
MLLDVLFSVRCAGCGLHGAPVCPGCSHDLSCLGLEAAVRPGWTAAAFRYEGVARSLILGLKLRSLRPYALPLADEMAAALHRGGTDARWIAWVPARRPVRRRRGFDQAAVLAAEVAARTGLEPIEALRASDKLDQVGLDRQARALNARAGFAATAPPPAPGASLVLIDDLVTSGATAAACAERLLAIGWAEVAVLAACRA